MDKVIFSGIKPSGDLHIGNYLGAVKHWVDGQEDGLNIFCVVDLHAITVQQDPKELKEKTLEIAAILLASGISPEKSILFIQSHNLDHANLAWILNCNISMGQLNRMVAYKEKSEKQKFASVGLFDYPALMAADILLYNTTHVPVGEDQKQHIELARDVAQKFNSIYGETFVIPEPVIAKTGARIMSLSNPSSKMSKSDEDQNGVVSILDEPDIIRKKFAKAVTDSDSKIKYSEDKPGVSNLIEIYSHFTDQSVKEVEKKFEGASYGEFKKDLAEVVVEKLAPIQEKYKKLRSNDEELMRILNKGAAKSRKISNKKLKKVFEKVGFVK